MEETWKDIEGYEGLYMVSSHGRVWSYRYETMLKQNFRGNYLFVRLYKDKKACGISIHRLVALNFLKKSNEKNMVNHLDENKLNNKSDNLEWCTAKENTHHGTNLQRSGLKRRVKVVGVNVLTGEQLYFDSMTETRAMGFEMKKRISMYKW